MRQGHTESPFDTRGFARDVYLIGGVRTVVYSVGEGPAVMYWHGRGTWHGFAWARDLQHQYRVLLPYHPGFGESEDDPTMRSVGDYVRHYVDLIDHLQIPRLSLIGASMGGYMAANFAIAHPERIERFVLVSPAGAESPDYPVRSFRDVPFDELPRMFVVNREVLAPFWPDRWNERIMRETDSGRRILGGTQAPQNAWMSRLATLHRPALILWGRGDQILPVNLSRLWAAAIPGSVVRVIENAGHLLLDESPEARRVLRAFLSLRS